MPNITANLPLDIIGSISIVIVALFAISQPKSRIKHAKKSLKQAHKFTKHQRHLDKVIGGNK